MEMFRPSYVQDGQLLFHMYTRGIFTESKLKECNLLAAVTFCSEKCKATLIRPFTYGVSHQYMGQMAHEIRRASPT